MREKMFALRQPSTMADYPLTRLDMAIDHVTKVCFQLSAVLFTMMACIRFTGINPLAPKTAHATTWYTYQANFNEVKSIVNWGTTPGHNWPEHMSN